MWEHTGSAVREIGPTGHRDQKNKRKQGRQNGPRMGGGQGTATGKKIDGWLQWFDFMAAGATAGTDPPDGVRGTGPEPLGKTEPNPNTVHVRRGGVIRTQRQDGRTGGGAVDQGFREIGRKFPAILGILGRGVGHASPQKKKNLN